MGGHQSSTGVKMTEHKAKGRREVDGDHRVKVMGGKKMGDDYLN